MNPLVKHLFDFLAGMLTKQRLAEAGAGPDALKGAMTTMVELPTFGEAPGRWEFRARAAIVSFMRDQLGKQYQLGTEVKPGHEDETTTWDCSECTEAAYRTAGMSLCDGADAQYHATQAINNPLDGDLGFLWSDKRGMIGHVMVCTGEGTVIHAVGGRGVVEDPLHQWDGHVRWRGWRRHIDFARPPEDRA